MSHKLAKVIKYNKRNYQASKSASSINAHGQRLGDRLLHYDSITNVATGTFAELMRWKAIGNTFFEGVRRLRPRYKAREPRDDGSERRRPEKNCIPIALALLPAIVTLSVLASPATYAEPYALSISFIDSDNDDISSPTMELNVTPNRSGSFSKSSTSTIGVGTTSVTGYSISIAAASSDGDKLINSNDSNTDTNHLSSITTAITEEQFKALPSSGSESPYNNQWGYLPSMWDGQANTLFRPAPTVSGHVLNSTTTANPVSNSTASDVCKRYACDKYDITVGARVDATQKIGTYSNTYVVYATANGTPYTIKFKDNTITLPADISANAMSSTITIPSDIPTKDGYTFLGWCTVSPTNNSNGTDTCDGTTYDAGGTWAITEGAATNSLTLYAMWQEKSFDIAFTAAGKTKSGGYYLMQDMTPSICNSAAIGQTAMLYDSRDNEAYTIAKLKDGRCWMLDNLRLGSDEPIPLTPNDTNITSDFTLPASISSGFESYTEAQINASYKTSTATNYGKGSGKVGVYYNFCAASAGTYCYDPSSGTENASYDICPAGWRLPTGNADGGEYANLVNKYGYSNTSDATNINSAQYRLSLSFSGLFVDSSQKSKDTGCFWTSTRSNNREMLITRAVADFLHYGSGSFYYRPAGLSVRCIANN